MQHLFVARQYSDFKEQSIAEPSARAGHVQPLRISLFLTKMVGLGRIELPTSPLSGVRSSQLSYRPTFKSLRAETPPDATERRWRDPQRQSRPNESSFNMVELVGIEPATS